MPRPEEFGFNTEQIIEEVKGKIESYESKWDSKISKVEKYWSLYEGRDDRSSIMGGQPKKEADGQSLSYVHETARAVDNLATTRYRMMMAADPPFEVLPQRDDISEEELYKISSLHSFQMEKTEYRKNLRKALTSLDLIGTIVVEEPWLSYPLNSSEPIWEGVGFVPRPLNQVFFSPHSLNIESSDYIGSIDIVSKYRLKQLSQNDSNETAWIQDFVNEALSDDSESDSIPAAVKSRLTAAGFADLKGNKELVVYYGPLESQNAFEDWVVGLVNRKYLVRFHKPVLPFRPFRTAYINEVEQSPWGRGVGPKAETIQRMLNSNRKRIFDLIIFATYSMMKASKFAGLDPRDLRVKPFNILFMDDINGLEFLRPDIGAAQFGIKMEEMLKDEFQSVTGATKNLQAITTEATATEASLVMGESIRRVSVDTEIIADSLLRQHLIYAHKMNLLFLDKPIWIGVTGSDKPLRIFPSEIAKEVDFKVKITTDQSFRPKRLQMLIQALQLYSSYRNDLAGKYDPQPLLEEVFRMLGIDQRRLKPKITVPSLPHLPTSPQSPTSGFLNKEMGLAQSGVPEPLIGGEVSGPGFSPMPESIPNFGGFNGRPS